MGLIRFFARGVNLLGLPNFKSIMELPKSIWDSYNKKYKKLMHTISLRMNMSDRALDDPEDNFQELQIEGFKSFLGYAKSTGLTPEQFHDTEEFDKYTKSCLWHYKARKAIRLVKKSEVRNLVSLSPTDDEENFSLSSCIGKFETSRTEEDVLRDLKLTEDAKDILKIIISEPSVTRRGSVSLRELNRLTKIPVKRLRDNLAHIQEELINAS